MSIQQIIKIVLCINLLFPFVSDATELPSTKPTIVFIHGLNMNHLSMKYIDRKFQNKGYNTAIFSYKSRKFDIPIHAKNFITFLKTIDGPKVIIAHSLGSLVTLEAIRHEPNNLSITHVITLAAPLQGSQTAQRINQLHLDKILIGKTTTNLLPKQNQWTSNIPLGSIAGKRPLGATRIFIPSLNKSDGTVAIEETKIKGMTDHIEVAATHSGILFSNEVVEQCLYFIKHNKFEHL